MIGDREPSMAFVFLSQVAPGVPWPWPPWRPGPSESRSRPDFEPVVETAAAIATAGSQALAVIFPPV